MKKITVTTLTGLVLTLLLTLNSCKKGDTGPAGVNGTNGTNGNANVTARTFTATSATWLNEGDYWTFHSSGVTELTQENVDNAVVMCYVFSTGTGSWRAMPYTENDIEVYSEYHLNLINFKVRSASGTKSLANPGNMIFKYVIIPPAYVKPNVNTDNYDSVKNAYKLQN